MILVRAFLLLTATVQLFGGVVYSFNLTPQAPDFPEIHFEHSTSEYLGFGDFSIAPVVVRFGGSTFSFGNANIQPIGTNAFCLTIVTTNTWPLPCGILIDSGQAGLYGIFAGAPPTGAASIDGVGLIAFNLPPTMSMDAAIRLEVVESAAIPEPSPMAFTAIGLLFGLVLGAARSAKHFCVSLTRCLPPLV